MIDTKQKYFLGRKVKEEKVITRGPNVEYGALYEAAQYLSSLGFRTGSLDNTNPIGFKYLSDPIPKWHNLSKEDKNKLNGILISEDFRNKDVRIIFFEL